MATVINITDKIKNEQKFLAWGEKTYKVNSSKNAIMEVYAKIDEGGLGPDTLDEILEILLGADAVKDFSDLEFDDYLVPFFASMAAVQGKSYEDVEASFRDSK